MSSPPIPPSLDHLATRPFSFYPPILNIERNEWLYRKGTWSEILVVNCKGGEEIWIPRRFLDDVSRVDDPVLIVGLTKELEYKAGAVWPYQRRVIEMPLAVGGASPPSPEPERTERAPVVDIRVAPRIDKRVFRLIGSLLTLAILFYLAAVNLTRISEIRQRSTTVAGLDHSYLGLTSRDDYNAVVARLGPPVQDRWLTESGELQYRALSYPSRRFTVILMGSSRGEAVYIGAMDPRWRPLHSVQLPSGGTTTSLLRGLRRF